MAVSTETESGLVHLIVVDDNQADRFLFKRLALSASPDTPVFESPGGQAFLDQLQEGDFDNGGGARNLVFLDISMPGMDGFEVLEHLDRLNREQQLKRPLRVVMHSASCSQADSDRASAFPFVEGLWPKPLRPDDLERAIEQLPAVS